MIWLKVLVTHHKNRIKICLYTNQQVVLTWARARARAIVLSCHRGQGQGQGKKYYHVIVGKGKGNSLTTHIDMPDHRTLHWREMRFPDTKARVTSTPICLHTSRVSFSDEILDRSWAHYIERKCVFLTQKPGSHRRRVPSLSRKCTDCSWSWSELTEEILDRSWAHYIEGKCVFLTQKPGSHQRRVPSLSRKCTDWFAIVIRANVYIQVYIYVNHLKCRGSTLSTNLKSRKDSLIQVSEWRIQSEKHRRCHDFG